MSNVLKSSSPNFAPTSGGLANASNGKMTGHGSKTSYPGKGGNSFKMPAAQANATEGKLVGPGSDTSYPSKKGGKSFPMPPAQANVSEGKHVGPSNAKNYGK